MTKRLALPILAYVVPTFALGFVTTIAVAAKNVTTSVPDYLLIETAFTVAQWIIVEPLTALAFEGSLVTARSKS